MGTGGPAFGAFGLGEDAVEFAFEDKEAVFWVGQRWRDVFYSAPASVFPSMVLPTMLLFGPFTRVILGLADGL